MIGTVYIEEEVLAQPRTQRILSRLPAATQIPIQRYGEVFNVRSQSFRLQKVSPSLILAAKHSGHVLPTPEGYGLPGYRCFYFSHMLNCLYDCRYCFLQGMFRSAHYVLFVNYDDFEAAVREAVRDSDRPCFFFSGYDCDSLAFEGVSGFAASFLDFFADLPEAFLELRTKSVAIDALLSREALSNVVVAYSLSPHDLAAAYEHKTPGLESRLVAMERLARAGWKLGLRFDPLLYHRGFRDRYRQLFDEVFRRLDVEVLHSVSLGPFRLPASYFSTLTKLYPEEALLAAPMEDVEGVVSYRKDLLSELTEFCTGEILGHIPREIFHPCLSGEQGSQVAS